MAWTAWYTSFSDAFKKRAGRYLINRYLGTFLDETISLEQLSVDGAISLSNVALNIRTINALIDEADLPVEFVDGFIQNLSVTIPWSNLLQESCFFSIEGLTITLQVKKRANPAQISASIFHSMCESFSSFSVAEDCLKQGDVHSSPGKSRRSQSEEDMVSGVELLAQAIDSVIMRVQVRLTDTVVRLEHLPGLEQRGLALQLQLGSLIYSGQASQQQTEAFATSTVSKIYFENVILYTDEFSLERKGSPFMARSMTASGGMMDSARYEQGRGGECEIESPLQLASLTGHQELVLRFTEINQFGLPRAVDEVEMSLGVLKIHIFPHQVFILSAIVSAITVPAKPQPPQPRHHKALIQGIEGLLQENLRFGDSSGGLNVGWGGDMDASREFKPLPKLMGRPRPFLTDETGGREADTPPPMPRIIIRSVGLVAVIKEKDPGILKMGGEPSKPLALAVMRAAANNFFSCKAEIPSAEAKRIKQWHTELSRNVPDSHIQILGSPLTVVYEEGPAVGSSVTASYAILTKITVGKLSVAECLVECDSAAPHQLIALLSFPGEETSRKNPDLKLVYKESFSQEDKSPVSNISLSLNPCSVDLDPGLVDRTYILLNYAEMDPDCLKILSCKEGDDNCNLEVAITCPTINLRFHIPRPDLRNPQDIGLEFLRTYWTRKVHPEVYNIQMEGFSLGIEQHGGDKAPLDIGLAAAAVEASYKEASDSNQFSFLQARRLSTSDATRKSLALELRIKVCMDPSLRLQGRFNSGLHRMQKSVFVPKVAEEEEEGGQDSEHYFIVDPDSGGARSPGGQKIGAFLSQTQDILSALRAALLRNNLLIDVKLDAVSIVIPNKRLYEVIYNRVGNDLLLWLPTYMAVKEHIYGERNVNPLEDDSAAFSAQFCGRSLPQIAYEHSPPPQPKHTNAFPKDKHTGPFEIHTDTAVSLSVKQVELLICLPLDSGSATAGASSSSGSGPLGLLHVSALQLGLVAAAGLDRDPEISIFQLAVGQGCIRYGRRTGGAATLPSQIHFNPSLAASLEVLVTTNSYCDRAWPSKTPDSELLKLTAKILLDTTTNLKSIQLAFSIVQGGVCIREPDCGADWVAALASFFTVVEFPVLGYVPPVILTEMHFVLHQSAIELAPPDAAPATAALCIGKLAMSCSLLDTTQDASVVIAVEDAALYLSKEGKSSGESAVCVADIDYLDIAISLTEPEDNKDKKAAARMSVNASCNLLRMRTCADTLLLLVEIFSKLGSSSSSSNSSFSDGGDGSEDSVRMGSESEDILPDLEDAMAELSSAAPLAEPRAREKSARTGIGAQVFFFPDENCPLTAQPPPIICSRADPMTQSMYVEHDKSEESDDLSDLESFCILEEEEGSGIVPSSGEPAIRCLLSEGIQIFDNHLTVPNEAVDYLKAPKGFPVSLAKLAITKLSLLWQIFGGNDFSDSRQMKSNTKEKLQQMGMSMIENRSRHCSASKPGTNTARHAADLLKTRGGPGRNPDLLIEVAVARLAAQHETYLLSEELNCPSSRQILTIPTLEIRDRLSESEINKLLHGYSSRARPRQSSAHLLSLKVLTLRPDPATSPLEETSIKVSLQPLRINIDQDTLFFIIDFVNSLLPAEEAATSESSPSPPQPMHTQAAVYRSRTCSGDLVKYSGLQGIRIEVPEGSEVFEDARGSPPRTDEGTTTPASLRSKSSTPAPPSSNNSLTDTVFVKSFLFAPAVPIRIDYVGKYVDLTQGALTGLLAGLAQLNCSEITLKQLELRQGILGLDRLAALAAQAWLADIRSCQLPALLGGVGPMHALLQMAAGVRDLFLMPIEQYRKDGRIVRGLQKGTTSFTHSTTLSLLDMTNKLLSVVKFAAELAFDVMSPEGCVVQGKLPHPTQYCRRRVGRAGLRRARGTPHDVREGMLGAMALVREGLDETARSLAAAAGERGCVGGVLRAVPSTMVRPVILGAAATSNLLDGMKNQISPDQRLEEEDKWRTHPH